MSPLILPVEPFTAAALPRLGLTPRELRGALERRQVRRLLRGVYVDATATDSIQLRTTALRLVVQETHVVVDRTAAWLHGIDAYSAVELEAGPPVETCALRGHTRTRLDGVRGRTRDLGSEDVMLLDGLRLTTPLRTALDLGCHLRRREAFAALCGLAHEHGVTAPDLVAAVDRFRRRRGVVQLRELIPLVDPRIESPREAWTFLAIHDAGLPLPEPQLWIDIDGVPTFRLDFAYPQRRICVEYDGIDGHERTEEQRRYDRKRRGWLRDHGWTVIVVRLGDFTGAGLERWLGELRAALGSTYSTRRW
jgi:hypothetical protein